MLVKKLKEDKLFLGGFIALVLAAILGIALGAATIGAKNGLWSFVNVYDATDKGRAAMALGVIALLIGLAALGLMVFVILKPEMLAAKLLLIISVAFLIVVIIFGSVSVDYANATVLK
ncbi:hypothetical protein [Mycoplasma todarodis]|uniref:Uncharacterized protein n=1 Tax=Mycoplasma todarodis TaxID=1937191 RepID=A0A4R0XUE6_9MOLU|nr:hypothetical protein [Mycoplasma todarodis]TCG10491.1 hypothetical protein C4B25_03985 [Mycoplasma todarodis]